jgi:Tol biopolymer transport system component
VIYVVNADGTGLRRLADGWAPEWSPDGSTIVYATDASPDCSPYSVHACDAAIRVIRPDGTGSRGLPVTGDEPHWSPDGTRIVLTRFRPGQTNGVDSDLWIVGADGTGGSQLTHLGTGEGAFTPGWSADGTAVVYSGYRNNNDTCARCTGQDADWELFRLDLRTGEEQQLTDAYGRDDSPSVQPT